MAGWKELTEEEVDNVLMELPEGSTQKQIDEALEHANKSKVIMSVDHEKDTPQEFGPYDVPPSNRKVGEGETLSEIALEYSKHYGTEVTAESIAAANKLPDPNKVPVDTVLDMTKFIKKAE